MYLNLLKSDLYRVKKAKSLWILILVMAVLFVFWGYTVLRVDVNAVGLNIEELLNTEDDSAFDAVLEGYQMGYNAGRDSFDTNKVSREEVVWGEGFLYGHNTLALMEVFSSLTLSFLMASIFIPLFIGKEFDNGCYKNVVITNGNRIIPVLSKLTIGFLYSVLLQLVTFVMIFAVSLLMRCPIIVEFTSEFWGYFFTSWLLLLAFICVVIMLCCIFRSKVAPMVISICLSLSLVSAVTSIIDKIISAAWPNSNFRITRFLLTDILGERIGFEFGSSNFGFAIAVGLVYIAITVTVSILVPLKRDLK